LNDLYAYDLTSYKWTDLSYISKGVIPSPRWGHGFVTAGGRLYLQGGYGSNG
jgi:hypothetical protein